MIRLAAESRYKSRECLDPIALSIVFAAAVIPEKQAKKNTATMEAPTTATALAAAPAAALAAAPAAEHPESPAKTLAAPKNMRPFRWMGTDWYKGRKDESDPLGPKDRMKAAAARLGHKALLQAERRGGKGFYNVFGSYPDWETAATALELVPPRDRHAYEREWPQGQNRKTRKIEVLFRAPDEPHRISLRR